MLFAPGLRRAFVIVALTGLPVSAVSATDLLRPGDIVMIQAAPDVIHFQNNPEYTGRSWLVGVEWERPSRWLGGFSYFNNSFGQRSQYLYAGKSWRPLESYPNWYFKLTGGVIHGYKGRYEDKLLFNQNGYAPAVLPGVGYKFDRFSVQLSTLGASGAIITVGYDLIR